MAEKTVQRFSTYGRVLHWATAITFLYALLSGVGIAFPNANWLLTVLGGGSCVRMLHPWAGIIFSGCGILMLFHLWKHVSIHRSDIEWMVGILSYIRNQDDKLPETYMFNAGQKMYFWITVFCGSIVFFISGIPMLFPFYFMNDIVQLAIVVHELMFIAALAFFIVHIYMGTLGMPGTMSTLITGKVTEEWAKAHHPAWLRKVKGNK